MIPENKREIYFFYMELLESKTSDAKLFSEQEILADSLLPSHLYSISAGTG